MIRKSVKVQLSGGLLAAPMALLVQKANEYESTVYLEAMERRVNLKSIMGVMSLNVIEGDEVTLECAGADEVAATESVERFLLGAATL